MQMNKNHKIRKKGVVCRQELFFFLHPSICLIDYTNKQTIARLVDSGRDKKYDMRCRKTVEIT